jgi:hypothetical protein
MPQLSVVFSLHAALGLLRTTAWQSKYRRHPVIPEARNKATSFISVPLFPRERTAAMMSERLAGLKTSIPFDAIRTKSCLFRSAEFTDARHCALPHCPRTAGLSTERGLHPSPAERLHSRHPFWRGRTVAGAEQGPKTTLFKGTSTSNLPQFAAFGGKMPNGSFWAETGCMLFRMIDIALLHSRIAGSALDFLRELFGEQERGERETGRAGEGEHCGERTWRSAQRVPGRRRGFHRGPERPGGGVCLGG